MIFLSIIVGFVAIAVYYLFGTIRRGLKRPLFICYVEDVLIAIIFAFGSYMLMLKMCGIVRGFNFIFECIGAYIAYRIIELINYKNDIKSQGITTAKEALDGIKKSSKKKKT